MFAPPIPLETIPAETLWPEQGDWTYEDYLRLPDDGRRYEIIEGVLYVANAPSYAHQFTVFKLARLLGNHVEDNDLGIVFGAPFEVHLSHASRPVQPDLLFIATERQPHPAAKFYDGAPDIVVEALSPSTRRYDLSVKLDAYERSGVREYWLADPETRSITLYFLPDGGQEYVLGGVFTGDDYIISTVLTDLKLQVTLLFV